MIAVFIIGLLACVPVPSFTRVRTTSQTNSCVNILLPYLDHNIAPVCPVAGTYSFTTVGAPKRKAAVDRI
jgi:hypothetical protein